MEDLGGFKGNVDLIVGGSPCQDFSIAGKQQGSTFECLDCEHEFNPLVIHYSKRDECPKCNSSNLEKTRSSLLIEYLRTIREIKPKYFVYENVKNIVGKKFKDAFDLFEAELQEYGFNTYWQVLNAKDYGIPQNRERVFVVGIRKDIDSGKFEFPTGFDNGLRLKDFLLDEVEEKYYIESDAVSNLISKLKDKDSILLDVSQAKREGKPREYSEYAPTLNARDYKEPRLINEKTKSMKVGNINPSGRGMNGNVYDLNSVSPTLTTNKGEGIKVLCEPNELKLFTNLKGGKWDKIHESARRVYDENGISPTIPTCGGGNIEPKVAVREATKKGYAIASVGDSINLEQPNSNTRRGRVGKGVINTLTTSCNQAVIEPRDTMIARMCAVRGRYDDDGQIEQQLEIQKDEISNSLTTVQKDSMVLESVEVRHTELPCIYDDRDKGFGVKTIDLCPTQRASRSGIKCIQDDYRIRKLTPQECFRLMGFSDKDYWKARKALEKEFYKGKDRSNSQMYKMAGNSIAIPVLEAIFKNLLHGYINKEVTNGISI